MPWCPHCENLKPILEELVLKVQAGDNLVVAQIDMESNELGIDLGIKGYPTMYLWTEGVPLEKPIEFKQQRSL